MQTPDWYACWFWMKKCFELAKSSRKKSTNLSGAFSVLHVVSHASTHALFSIVAVAHPTLTTPSTISWTDWPFTPRPPARAYLWSKLAKFKYFLSKNLGSIKLLRRMFRNKHKKKIYSCIVELLNTTTAHPDGAGASVGTVARTTIRPRLTVQTLPGVDACTFAAGGWAGWPRSPGWPVRAILMRRKEKFSVLQWRGRTYFNTRNILVLCLIGAVHWTLLLPFKNNLLKLFESVHALISFAKTYVGGDKAARWKRRITYTTTTVFLLASSAKAGTSSNSIDAGSRVHLVATAASDRTFGSWWPRTPAWTVLQRIEPHFDGALTSWQVFYDLDAHDTPNTPLQ